jgi:hypothetical protein
MTRTARVTLRLSPGKISVINEYADSRHMPQSVALRSLIRIGLQECRKAQPHDDNNRPPGAIRQP